MIMEFQGRDLRKIRVDMDLTQEQFAEQIGYSRDYIQRLEANTVPMSHRLVKILEKIGFKKDLTNTD